MQRKSNPDDLFRFERGAAQRGCTSVAGVDEVGRGPLAGPVVAAAVVLPASGCSLHLADSKTLSANRREQLSEQLFALADAVISFGVADVEEIDRINILRATHRAMQRALLSLSPPPDFALVDGLAVPGLPVGAEFIVKGDAASASIAAASILAKVHRDRMMSEYDKEFPGYGFAQHKGYGTQAHLAALSRLGPCPIHRRSFAPVARLLEPGSEQLQFTFE